MIQFRHITTGNIEEDNKELAKVLTLLDENKIEYDITAPKKFKAWKAIGNKTFLIPE